MSTSDPAHDYSEEVHAWFADDDEDDVDDDFEDEFGDDDDDDDEDDDEEDSEDRDLAGLWEADIGQKTPGPSLDFRSGTCLNWRPLSSSSELDPFGGLRVCLPAQSLGS